MNYRIFFWFCAGIIACNMTQVHATCIKTMQAKQLEARKMFAFFRQHACYKIQQLQTLEPSVNITETDGKVIINCKVDVQGISHKMLEQFIRPEYIQEINEKGELVEYIRLRVFSNTGLFSMYIESEKVTTNFNHMTKNSSKKCAAAVRSADMQEALKHALYTLCKDGSGHDYSIAPVNIDKSEVRFELQAEHGVKIILEKQHKKLVEPLKIHISD